MIASKSKRLLLENGAVKADIGPEGSSGTIWYRSKYVSNAVIIVPPRTGGQVIWNDGGGARGAMAAAGDDTLLIE